MYRKSASRIAIVAAALALSIGAVTAAPLGMTRSAVPSASSFIGEGEIDLAPISHVKFCMNYADECSSGSGRDFIEADDANLTLISQVNEDINRRIRPHAKPGAIGNWEIAPAAGDCNDYAVTKRHRLIAAGLPASALRLTVVTTAWGEGHLVLAVRTEVGDLVLDNLTSRVKPWNQTGHRFLKIQSASNARTWVSIEPSVWPRAKPIPARASVWYVAEL